MWLFACATVRETHFNAGNSITDVIFLSGQSDRMVLQAYTQKSDQLFETNESALTNMDGFQLTPVFGVLMTVGCSMAIVFLSISGKNIHNFLWFIYTKYNVFHFSFNISFVAVSLMIGKSERIESKFKTENSAWVTNGMGDC